MKRLLQKIKQKTLFTWSDETAKISVRIANYTLAAAILFGFWVAGQATRQPDQNAYASIMQVAKLPVWLTMGSNNNNSDDDCGNGGSCENNYSVPAIYNASNDSDSQILNEHQSGVNEANTNFFNDIDINMTPASNVSQVPSQFPDPIA